MLSWPFLQSNFEPCDVQPLAYESHQNLRQNLSWLSVHKWLVLSLWICPPLDESIPVPLALLLDEWTASDEDGLGTEQPAKNYFVSELKDITNTTLSLLSTELLAKLKVGESSSHCSFTENSGLLRYGAVLLGVLSPTLQRNKCPYSRTMGRSSWTVYHYETKSLFLCSIRNHSPYDTVSQSMRPTPQVKLLKKSPACYETWSFHYLAHISSSLAPVSAKQIQLIVSTQLFFLEIHINITLPTLCNTS